MKKSKTPRFQLLIYRAFAKHWRTPALLVFLAGIAFWWLASRSGEAIQDKAWAGLVIAVVGVLIVFYTVLTTRAHVSCHRSNFVVHTPLYPVAFSYRRTDVIRSTEIRTIFPPEQEKEARRRFYHDIWGKTAIVVTVKSYPMPLWWLRLWFHPYMFHPEESALVFIVDDWMALSRSLETFRTSWREARH
jgi:hypothetical protein